MSKFLILLCLQTGLTFAQIRVHRAVGVEDGLVQSQVVSMKFDSRGFLWIGTLGGLSRWDGRRFLNFGTKHGLTSIGILAIEEGPDSTLYVGTSAGGLNLLRDGQWTSFSTADGLSNQTVRAILIDGDTWILGTDDGLNVVRRTPDGKRHVRTFFRKNRISSLIKVNDSTVWIANYDEGLFALSDTTVRRLYPDIPALGRGLRQLRNGADGRILALNETRGLAIVTAGAPVQLPAKDRVSGLRQLSVLEDTDGSIYLGGAGTGVIVIRRDTIETLGRKEGVHNGQVTAIERSPSGQIVFGTWGGLRIYDHDRVVTYNASTGLSAEVILSIAQRSDGAMLFGNYQGMIDVLENGTTKPLNHWDRKSSIWALHATLENEIFAGTHSHGAFRMTAVGMEQFEKELVDNRVYSILKARDGSVYFATRFGVTVLREGRFAPLMPQNQRDFYYTMMERANGELLFGTRVGVLVFSHNRIDTIDRRNGLSDNQVWSLREGPEGALYIGTNAGGLNILKNGKTTVYTSESGLSDNTIYGIEFDASGRCYLATNKGVNVLIPDESGVRIRVIRKSDGLANDECSQGAVFKDRTGNLWFGTIDGVSRLDPRIDLEPPAVPKVHITQFRVFEDEVRFESLRPNHEFNHNENYLKFDFVGINFSAPDRVTYRYRMSGVDKGWVQTDRDFVQYPGLDDGSYVFEVMACNEWGRWSDPLRFEFSVRPPFWETWWFMLLTILVVFGTAAYVVYARFQQVLAVERLRTKISADFHDTIGAGLTQVHVLSQVAVTRVDQKDDLLKNLKTIDEVSKSLYEEMRDIVWLVNPKKDTLYDLLIRLQESNEDLLGEQGITFETVNLMALEKIRIPMEDRHHIYLLFREALNNSIKYSRCESIRLEVEKLGRTVRMTYSDDGIGFDMQTVRRGNGLNNIADRARAVGGRVEFETAPGQGLRIVLTMKR